MEDPLNTYYRYPIARWLVSAWLVRTRITPNQVTLVQPFLAAFAGYLLTFADYRYHLAALVVFEVRSILDCVDGTLARAKNMASPSGHAVDALADWLCVVFLYVGIYFHLSLHGPPAGALGAGLPVFWVVGLALLQGAIRSFSFDYYKNKYCSIFETGRDSTIEPLRAKALALSPKSTFFDRAEVFIGRMQHLSFEYRSFDPHACKEDAESVAALRSLETSSRAKMLGRFWGLSNGDAFISLTLVSILLGQIWLAQVLWCTVGFVWILGFVGLNGLFVRTARRQARLAVA